MRFVYIHIYGAVVALNSRCCLILSYSILRGERGVLMGFFRKEKELKFFGGITLERLERWKDGVFHRLFNCQFLF